MTTKKSSVNNTRSPGKSVSIVVVPIAITTTSSSTVWEANTAIDGEVVAIDYDMPTFVNYGLDMTFNFVDEDDNVWHTNAGIDTAQHTLETLNMDTTPRRFAFTGTATLQATTVTQTTAQDLTANIIVYVKNDS